MVRVLSTSVRADRGDTTMRCFLVFLLLCGSTAWAVPAREPAPEPETMVGLEKRLSCEQVEAQLAAIEALDPETSPVEAFDEFVTTILEIADARLMCRAEPDKKYAREMLEMIPREERLLASRSLRRLENAIFNMRWILADARAPGPLYRRPAGERDVKRLQRLKATLQLAVMSTMEAYEIAFNELSPALQRPQSTKP